ncbi:VacJ family lipoprotein [Frateuria sp. GZRR35]|uniref:MlaA family lipoprotein n=1 Tax=unclassified Frateuria TaxID=2648894 RepID=UPI003EDBEF48
MLSLPRFSPSRLLPLAALALLAGCTIAKPRTDDPLEKFNRKVYSFNNAVDKAVIRPVAVGYRKITNPPVRRSVSDFFTNIRMPITVANDLLQARPKQALQSTGRFLVNLTLGLGGFFDPASQLGIPLEDNDFGVTLARWGVPDGEYLVLPLIGPTTVRDVWRMPVDSYFFDPLSIYARNHDYKYGQQYLPQMMYLVTLRSRGIDAESFLESAYDPYVFMRDAYRQRRLYQIYDGNPPAEVIQQMQGLNDDNFDPEQLLDEQHQWENKHSDDGRKQP